MREPAYVVSDQVHVGRKQGYAMTENDYRIVISDLGSRGIILSTCI